MTANERRFKRRFRYREAPAGASFGLQPRAAGFESTAIAPPMDAGSDELLDDRACQDTLTFAGLSDPISETSQAVLDLDGAK
jgi:hypothetical protein